MHVHVETPNGTVKVWIEPNIELATKHGVSNEDINEIISITNSRKEEIINAWNEHFKK